MGIQFSVYKVFGGLLIILGIIGNSLVIVYFAFKVVKKTSYHIFMLLLALTDLIGCVAFLFEWLQFVASGWFLGTSMCKFLGTLDMVSLGISSFLMTGMAYERYRGITKPLAPNKIRKNHVYLYFAFVSCLWVVFLTPYFMGHYIKSNIQKCFYTQLDSLFSVDEHYLYYITVEQFLKIIFPFIAMSYCYYQIKQTLTCQQSSLQNPVITKRNKNVLGTLKILIVVFAICVGLSSLSQSIFFLYVRYKSLNFQSSMESLFRDFVCCFLFVNNVINVFVYAGYVKEFRLYLKKLLFFCGS